MSALEKIISRLRNRGIGVATHIANGCFGLNGNRRTPKYPAQTEV